MYIKNDSICEIIMSILHQISETVDSHKESISDSAYLAIMNKLLELHNSELATEEISRRRLEIEAFPDEVKKSGSTYVKIWKNSFGQLHRDDDLPARCRYVGGRLESYEWYNDGVLIKTENYKDDYISTMFFNDGVLHKEDGPALMKTDYTGSVIEVQFYNDGFLHREEDTGPAYISHSAGFHTKIWYSHGKRHREGGLPAKEIINAGHTIYQAWYHNDLLNRLDGPAVVEFENDQIVCQQWWINGVQKTVDPTNPIEIKYVDGKVIKTYLIDNKLIIDTNGDVVTI